MLCRYSYIDHRHKYPHASWWTSEFLSGSRHNRGCVTSPECLRLFIDRRQVDFTVSEYRLQYVRWEPTCLCFPQKLSTGVWKYVQGWADYTELCSFPVVRALHSSYRLFEVSECYGFQQILCDVSKPASQDSGELEVNLSCPKLKLNVEGIGFSSGRKILR